MIASLDELAVAAEGLARIPELAAKGAADGIRAAIQAEFDAGQDPYGRSWVAVTETTMALRKVTTSDETPLTDTHGLRDSLNVYVRQDGPGVAIEIGEPDHPAAPHQRGWSGPQNTGPARPILPYAGLPDTWERAIEEAVAASIDELIGGAL